MTRAAPINLTRIMTAQRSHTAPRPPVLCPLIPTLTHPWPVRRIPQPHILPCHIQTPVPPVLWLRVRTPTHRVRDTIRLLTTPATKHQAFQSAPATKHQAFHSTTATKHQASQSTPGTKHQACQSIPGTIHRSFQPTTISQFTSTRLCQWKGSRSTTILASPMSPRWTSPLLQDYKSGHTQTTRALRKVRPLAAGGARAGARGGAGGAPRRGGAGGGARGGG